MNELEDRLREEMVAAVQEVQAPAWLPAAASRGGRRRLRRRRALLAAPASALTAGVVGAVVLGQGGWPGSGPVSSPAPAAGAPAAPEVSTSAAAGASARASAQAAAEASAEAEAEATPDPLEQAQLDAYFTAGYGWDEAVQLGQLWNVEPGEAKVSAGADLLAGRELPVAAPAVAADPEAPQREAFFAAGYTIDDAAQLGRLWNVGTYEAKIAGGTELLAGRQLPIGPSAPGTDGAAAAPATDPTAEGMAATRREAFTTAGYDDDDAVQLGRSWNVEPEQAKAMAGELLLAGGRLPVQP
ncbi:hypothetical protein GTQ99_18730 [Kineococcus sp. T13]|uniref:hypothetical protein n=1 Tax=Kineococcus vitellinus TaxID=2696565 RepID=UPI001411FBEE|nr:hypothetical protein [Kineococcus vitellinus]NAZ77442.1 hypothetical protein [Kineococcus vitellinus]